jgi:uncharacterized protein (UPF0335 family)
MAAAATNGFEPEKIKNFVATIEEIHEQLESEKGQYMKRCQSIRDDIKLVYDEAKDAGVPKKELKAVIKTRAKQRELDALREDLEADERDTYDMIRHALGDLADLPLGVAAMVADEVAEVRKRRKAKPADVEAANDAA